MLFKVSDVQLKKINNCFFNQYLKQKASCNALLCLVD